MSSVGEGVGWEIKKRGAKGLGGGWVNRRGVKMIQLICRKTGSNSKRKEEPDLKLLDQTKKKRHG